MLLEVRREPLVDDRLHRRLDLGVAELRLGLPLELRLACTFTDSTAVRPSRTSSPESVMSLSFLESDDFWMYWLMTRVSALLKPVRCVPPSCVLMLLTKEKTFSL